MGFLFLFKNNTKKILPRFQDSPKITGILDINSNVYVSYNVEGSDYESFQWKIAEDINGTNNINIENTGTSNFLKEEYYNKYISCEVIAYNQNGNTKENTPYYLIPSVPKILSNPIIIGSPALGQTLSVNYNIDNADVINIEWYSQDSSSQSEQLIVNENFESPIANIAFNGGHYKELSNQDLPGWTISGTIDVVKPNSNWPSAYEGQQVIDLIGSNLGSIYQTINLSGSNEYSFGFAYSKNPATNSASATYDIIDNNSTSLINGPKTIVAEGNNFNWKLVNENFNTSSPTATIIFTSKQSNSAKAGILLDKTSLNKVINISNNKSLIGSSRNQLMTLNELNKKISVKIIASNDFGQKIVETNLVGPVIKPEDGGDEEEPIISEISISPEEFANGLNVGEYVKCHYDLSGNISDPSFNWYISNNSNGSEEILLGNTTKDSYFLNDTTETKYIACELILPTVSGLIYKKSNYIGPIGSILGIPITQSMVGETGPYYISSTGTYYLAEDITTKNTAFVLNNEKITLNLNNKTLIYNNSDPIYIPNHSFENGFSGWDTTNAPNALLGSGTPITNRVHDGDYSLRFNLPLEDQYLVNEQEITLEPNNRYSLSAMFYTHNSSGTLYVQLSGVNVPHIRSLTYSGPNWRGMQFKELAFNTSGTPETYKIKVGVTSPLGSPAKSLYLDDIKIQKTYLYGVLLNPKSWQSKDNHPGVLQYSSKNANNITVKNGKIIQGQDKGTWSHSIFGYSANADTAVFDHLYSEVYGSNASNINITWGGAVVSNSDFISRISAVTSRDNFHGMMVGGGGSFRGTIYNNTFTDGPHAGVRASTKSGASKVYNNVFRMKNRYTNGFCISTNANTGVGGDPLLVYNNRIENTGIYSGRGIAIGGGNSTSFPRAIVYNNKIDVQGLATVPEYGGTMLGGCYAIQIEGGKGVLISGNDITAHATEASAWCVRYNSNVSPLLVVDNNLKAIRTNFVYSQHNAVKNVGGCIKPSDTNVVNVNNNIMSTNSTWVGGMKQGHNLQLSGNKLIIDGDYQKARWFETEWAAKGTTGIRFIDNIYNDDLARQTFEAAKIEAGEIIRTSPDSSFKASWSTEFRFLYNDAPLENVSAQIFDNSGTMVYSGLSDDKGKINTLLDQFQWVGSSLAGAGRRQYNDYTLIANLGDLSGSKTFTANTKQSIDIDMFGSDDILYTPIPPEQYIVQPYSLPTSGKTYNVKSGDNLQSIFNIMSDGDVVILDADSSWTGKYVIPPKEGNDWIYVISSRMIDLPAENTRVSLDDTGNMPKIYVGTATGSAGKIPQHPCLNISKGAKKVRFVGLNFSSRFDGTNAIEYGYIYLGHAGSSGIASDIIFDRCVLNGTKTGNHKHGMATYNISGAAIINCHFSEFHLSGGESYAIHCFDSRGPVLIENNYLEAAGINVFMGDNVNVFPRDITIRGNHIIKPLKWNKEHPSFEGRAWTSKNPLEIKAGSRFLIEGNRIENSWPSAQVGNGSLFTPRGNPVSDINYQNNVLLNCVEGISINNADKTLLRTRIANNIIYNYPRYLPSMSGSTNYSFSLFAGSLGANKFITIKNNTIIPVRRISGYLVMPMNSSKRKFLIGVRFENNIAQPGYYSLASMDGYGKKGADNLIDDYKFKNNILVGGFSTYVYRELHYPFTENWTGWVFLNNDGQVGYTNTGFTTLEDFRLLPSSPYYGSGIGADLDKILAVLRDPY